MTSDHHNQPAVSRQNQASLHLLQLPDGAGLLALPGLVDSRDSVIALMTEVGGCTGTL